MSPEAIGTAMRAAKAGFARRNHSARPEPRNMVMPLLPGTTIAMPRPEAEGM